MNLPTYLTLIVCVVELTITLYTHTMSPWAGAIGWLVALISQIIILLRSR